MTGAAAAPVVDEVDPFDAAFGEAVADAVIAPAGDETTPAKKDDAAPAGDKKDDGTPAADKKDDGTPPADDKGGAPAGDGEGTPAADGKVVTPPSDTRTAEQIAADKARDDRLAALESEKAAREAAEAKAAADEKARQDAEAAAPKPFALTPEQQKVLDDAKKEFPEVSAALEIQLQKIAHDSAETLKATVAQIKRDVEQGITPVIQTTAQLAHVEHRKAILGAHKDFDAVAPKVKEWVATQPAYLKAAFEATIADGSTEDVIDLVGRFKKETGYTAPQEQPSGQAAPQQATPPGGTKPAPAPAAASDLEAVTSGRRTAPQPNGVDKNDYDAAFAEATAGQK